LYFYHRQQLLARNSGFLTFSAFPPPGLRCKIYGFWFNDFWGFCFFQGILKKNQNTFTPSLLFQGLRFILKTQRSGAMRTQLPKLQHWLGGWLLTQ
jgi:hypothetical protein